MRKLSKFFSVIAVAVIALAGCSKTDSLVENQDPQVDVVQKSVKFTALGGSNTKTYFGDKNSDGKYPTVWTNVNKVAVSLNLASKKEAVVKPLTAGTTATFDVTITDDGSGDYKFYALSPASACLGVSSTYKSMTIEFPSSQTPTQQSVDEAAHIMMAESTNFSTFPESVDVTFTHLAAYGRFQLKNFPETVTIQSINIEAQENFVGRYYYYAEDNGSNAKGDLVPNSTSNIMTLHGNNFYEKSTINGDIVFWFACAPVNLSGKTMKISVNTDAGKYVKNITFPAGKGNFAMGQVASFNLDMTGIVPAAEEVYTLVTSLDELIEDSEVIIVAKDYNYALGTTQNPNNRAGVGITKESTTPSTIKSPKDAGAQVFVLEAGTVYNTIAFKCLNGDAADFYIYAASSGSNWLRSISAVDDNASFGLDLASDGTAVLTAKGANTRNVIKYNNGSTIFSCYSSTSTQLDVVLYKRNGTGAGDKLIEKVTPDPVIAFDATTNTVTITCSEPTAKIGYSIDGSEPGIDDVSGDPLPGTIEYTGPFTITSTVTVKAFAGAPHMESSNVVSKLCTYSAPLTGLTVWQDDFSSCVLSGTAIASLDGSMTEFPGSYSAISASYPMDGAIRVGKASAAGSITTPVLSKITKSSANLTITFIGAGWKGKNAKITLTASKGTVTEGETQITSEDSMSGSAPTMSGAMYTFHVTGADNTTTITFSTTNSIGIDNLTIVQTN